MANITVNRENIDLPIEKVVVIIEACISMVETIVTIVNIDGGSCSRV